MLDPQTKLLIGEYGNANFAYGDLGDDAALEEQRKASKRMITAKDALVAHLEENYIPKPVQEDEPMELEKAHLKDQLQGAQNAYWDAMVEIEALDHEAHRRFLHSMAPCLICELIHRVTEKHGRPIEPK